MKGGIKAGSPVIRGGRAKRPICIHGDIFPRAGGVGVPISQSLGMTLIWNCYYDLPTEDRLETVFGRATFCSMFILS